MITVIPYTYKKLDSKGIQKSDYSVVLTKGGATYLKVGGPGSMHWKVGEGGSIQ